MNDYKIVEKIIDLAAKGKVEWSSDYNYNYDEGDYWHGKYKGLDIKLYESWQLRKNLWINGIAVSINKQQKKWLRRIAERQISLIQSKGQSRKEREILDILEV